MGEHRLAQDAAAVEVRFCLRWMELRSVEDGVGSIAELRFYNHHCPRASLADVVAWNEEAPQDQQAQCSGHVIFFRDPEIRGSYRHGQEVKNVLFVAFRS